MTGEDVPCVTCRTEPAVACQECMRALALMFFGGIARHPETGTDCQLCEAGAPAYCPACLVSEVVSYRSRLREQPAYARAIHVGRDVE